MSNVQTAERVNVSRFRPVMDENSHLPHDIKDLMSNHYFEDMECREILDILEGY
jgi:hypothetical protein